MIVQLEKRLCSEHDIFSMTQNLVEPCTGGMKYFAERERKDSSTFFLQIEEYKIWITRISLEYEIKNGERVQK